MTRAALPAGQWVSIEDKERQPAAGALVVTWPRGMNAIGPIILKWSPSAPGGGLWLTPDGYIASPWPEWWLDVIPPTP